MKKFLLFALFAGASLNCLSQVSLGITTAGVLPLKKYGDKLPNPSYSYKFGLESIFKLSECVNIRTGVEFNSYIFIQKETFTNQAGNVESNVDQYFISNYIGIPVGLRYVFKGDKIKPFIDGSIMFSKNISNSTKIHDDRYSMYEQYTPEATPFITSGTLGLGLLMNPTPKTYLTFMMVYTSQFQYIYDVSNSNQQMTEIRYPGANAQLSFGFEL